MIRLLRGLALATAMFVATGARLSAQQLTLWHDGGDNGSKLFTQMGEAFAASHPGVSIRATNYPTDQWFGRVTAAINTDTAPDLIFNNYERLFASPIRPARSRNCATRCRR